ncbi:hypothetical protein [Streptomyces beihaiensis]|uniref:Secreted protein n=1 Tax=Streptomyces beihaiensis TaxID=2984495 RepID=A0ABT3TQV8_9ACTN|nr:hypothetical protein [Streptomyces beihaiensis]MCX3059434.1 hypothetical protein [Streptomyces beihaiensis]
MKAMKAAAVVAGSMVIAGAAAPAFASDLTPMSLNGALDTITSQSTLDAAPVDSNLLDPKNDGGVVGTVSKAAHGVNPGGANAAGSLLGGLPVG